MNSIMLLKLYRLPLIFIGFAVLISWVFGGFVAGLSESLSIGSSISDSILTFSSLATVIVIAGAFLTTLHSTYRLWKWEKGESDYCPSCGGIVDYKEGRYGPYHKCLQCGKNTSIK